MKITNVNQIHVNTKDNVTGLLVPHISVNVPVITREQTVNVSYHSVHSFLFIDNRSEKKSNVSNLKQLEMDVNVSRRVLTIGHCTDTGCTQSTDRTIKNCSATRICQKNRGRTMCSRKERG